MKWAPPAQRTRRYMGHIATAVAKATETMASVATMMARNDNTHTNTYSIYTLL